MAIGPDGETHHGQHHPSFGSKVRQVIVGKPRDLSDRSIFHRIALIPFLAWVGLGADGLSSSAYGPEEAFRALGEHKYLAVGLVLVVALTVFIISACYRVIIEAFPHGGGGYVVASKLLGRKAGLVSGCALLVDYILTITISIAAGGDAIFSFLPPEWHALKLPFEIFMIFLLTTLNIRGVKESVVVLTPVFIIFLITHIFAILWGIISHLPELPHTTQYVTEGFHLGTQTLGPWALFLLFVHAYSLGGGTYTGIEAVSNGLPLMREPKVETAKRTMTYMAISLAFTASGLLLCYLLWGISPVEGKTLNAVLLERIVEGLPTFGPWFVIIALVSEGLLLVVAAQAGFIDGPRVLANMAVDSWVPRRFAALSERLTTANGVVLMSTTSLLALFYTQGSVSKLVVMYSINVFLTFSLSIFGMLLNHLKMKKRTKGWTPHVILFTVGFVLCATILIITIIEKFIEGGWLTLVITGSLVLLCFNIKSHYLTVAKKLHELYFQVDKDFPKPKTLKKIDHNGRTAAVLVGGYGGLGIHTVQKIINTFPDIYKNFVFISVGIVDSGGFKGEDEIVLLKENTKGMLQKYVDLGQSLGIASTYRFAIGTEVVHEGELLCQEVLEEFPQTTFFTGKIIFQEEAWYQRLLHNETGLALQKRLQLAGLTLVVLPAKVV